jgi:hypothetical protein
VFDGDINMRMGTISAGLLDEDKIERLQKQVFEQMSSVVGKGMSVKLSEKLVSRFIKVMANDDAGKLTLSHLRSLGDNLKNINVADLMKVSIKSNDELDLVNSIEERTDEKLSVVASISKKYLESQKTRSKEDLVDAWLSLKNSVKKLTADDIDNIRDDVFKDVVSKLGKVKGMSQTVKKALASKLKKIFGGDVSKWDDAQVIEAGFILGGLSNIDIRQLGGNSLSRLPSMNPASITWASSHLLTSPPNIFFNFEARAFFTV